MNILVINAGSSSIKYKVLDPATGAAAITGKVERIGEKGRDHAAAMKDVVAAVKDAKFGAVGHRVVHGGARFNLPAIIDDQVIETIESLIPLAPLHNPANLAGIRAAMEIWADLRHVAVFDTAFHLTMPARAYSYAIDAATAAGHDIRRYGFHGPSHQYVAQMAASHLKTPLDELRIVTCHLGNGASACAVEYGKSSETSMGLTPLEGLVMGTRSGDLDPGVVLDLARKLGIDETDTLLNRNSGLKGLSGVSNDLRDILAAAGDGNEAARLAINAFAHRVRKYIGAYAAAMGGVDAVVMTGGIGENAAEMRRRILQRLDFLGLRIDDDANKDAKVGHDSPVADITGPGARVQTLVIKTNEELMIARETAKLVGGAHDVASKKPIPIAVSARHIHLDRPTLDALYGEGHELTKYKDISQPGQFACEEKLNIIGPRNRIDGVRILGPLRGKPQIEISRSDEFALGVDAPIRRSGYTKDSAPITLEGPKGTVQLDEGLICAWRHIHMQPEDAEAYGVKDGDYVEVAITGGPRDLIFGDVLVRVKSSYKLEMHIDTDEANAAELPPKGDGDLVYSPVLNGEAVMRTRKNPEE